LRLFLLLFQNREPPHADRANPPCVDLAFCVDYLSVAERGAGSPACRAV
jgi:hypothetical protein